MWYSRGSKLRLRSRTLPWRELLRPSLDRVALGLLVAAVMLAGAVLVVSMLSAIAPDFVAPATEIYRWADGAGPISILVLVAILITAIYVLLPG